MLNLLESNFSLSINRLIHINNVMWHNLFCFGFKMLNLKKYMYEICILFMKKKKNFLVI